jgi:hypothetical protein
MTVTATQPLAVIMITRNEAHNIPDVMANLNGFASEVFVVDSYSTDATVGLALASGAHVVQRPFRDFGDQWNFAVTGLPVTQPWTMKLDPDERLTDALKAEIARAIATNTSDAISFSRRLWFMGRRLPLRQDVLRIWRTGRCRFTKSRVNEHPIVAGRHLHLSAELEHHDSPNLHHWYDKQNRYSTAEANEAYTGEGRTTVPRFWGTRLERHAALKRVFSYLPEQQLIMTLYCLVVLGAWRGGHAGVVWALMRGEVVRMGALKRLEMRWRGSAYDVPPLPRGAPYPGVPQIDSETPAPSSP